MLSDFLDLCKTVLPDEKCDFRDVVDMLTERKPFISFMPAVWTDLWPIYVFGDTRAKRFAENKRQLYFVTIGKSGDYLMKYICKAVSDFYENDDLSEIEMGEIQFSVKEMILLRSGLYTSFDIPAVGNPDVIYMDLSLSGGEDVSVFFLREENNPFWLNTIQQFDIPVDVLIDSHKGMLGWLDTTELYQTLTSTQKKDLLPRLYFMGAYISNDPPDGYSFAYSVPESRPGEGMSEIYYTGYRK